MSTSLFRPESFYLPQDDDTYRFMPFRFMRWSDGDVLLTNGVGEHLFLAEEVFRRFTTKALQRSDMAYLDLKAKHFLFEGSGTVPIELLATKYRTKHAFLDGFTKLHLFVVTLRCDHSCPYCQVSRVTQDRDRFDMTRETARRAVDLMFRSPSRTLKVEFQGGEPLLAFDQVRFIVERVAERNEAEHRDIQFVVATNLSPLTDPMLSFFKEHRVSISTSLDGPAFLHNANRPRTGGQSYEVTVRNIARARDVLGHDQVTALMTTTEMSLEYARLIIDEYLSRGFDSIFLRPISPYGFALRSGAAWHYAVDRFVDFYKDGLAYIIDLNRQGHDCVEVYTQILLRRMLTPFSTGYVDLQSPAGAAIGVVAYNYDGDVYASDEARMLAEMGDSSFRLGNVHENNFEELFGGSTARAIVASSCLETLPGCSECAFAPYCGADPVYHWATQRDPVGHRPTSGFCQKNMAIFRHLFNLMRSDDPFIPRLFAAWASYRPVLRPDSPSASLP
jgi:uncharacterized protein